MKRCRSQNCCGHYGSYTTGSYLEVVWQFCSPSIARVHCHKHGTRGFERNLHSFKCKPLQLQVYTWLDEDIDIKHYLTSRRTLTFCCWASWIVVICCATTDNTSMSIRLNSSKQAHAPALAGKRMRKLKRKYNLATWFTAQHRPRYRYRGHRKQFSTCLVIYNRGSRGHRRLWKL